LAGVLAIAIFTKDADLMELGILDLPLAEGVVDLAEVSRAGTVVAFFVAPDRPTHGVLPRMTVPGILTRLKKGYGSGERLSGNRGPDSRRGLSVRTE